MAWCDVVEPRTLRECRIALGKSQAVFAAMLGASPESYRTWDARRLDDLKRVGRIVHTRHTGRDTTTQRVDQVDDIVEGLEPFRRKGERLHGKGHVWVQSLVPEA